MVKPQLRRQTSPPRPSEAPKSPRRRAGVPVAIPAKDWHSNDSGAWVLLNNSFYRSKEVSERNDGTVEIHIAPVDAEEDAALRALRPGRTGHVEPVPFAYKNDGFIARILSAELRSLSGKSTWLVSLKSDKDLRAYHGDANQQRQRGFGRRDRRTPWASLILLNESPPSQGTITNRLESMVSGLNSDIRVTEGTLPQALVVVQESPRRVPARRSTLGCVHAEG